MLEAVRARANFRRARARARATSRSRSLTRRAVLLQARGMPRSRRRAQCCRRWTRCSRARPRDALCAVRPPAIAGARHGALGACGNGFCIVNGVALGALYAAKVRGVPKVAVVDFDVHHGNGTQDILARTYDPAFLFVSVHAAGDDCFPGTGAEAGAVPHAGVLNLPVGQRMTPKNLFAVLPHIIARLEVRCSPRAAARAPVRLRARTFRPQAFAPFGLLMISAGFDGHRRDPMNLGALDAADYHKLTAALCAARESCAAGASCRSSRAATASLLRRRGRRRRSREHPRGRRVWHTPGRGTAEGGFRLRVRCHSTRRRTWRRARARVARGEGAWQLTARGRGAAYWGDSHELLRPPGSPTMRTGHFPDRGPGRTRPDRVLAACATARPGLRRAPGPESGRSSCSGIEGRAADAPRPRTARRATRVATRSERARRRRGAVLVASREQDEACPAATSAACDPGAPCGAARGAPRPRPKGRPSARRPRTRARTCRRRPRSRRRAAGSAAGALAQPGATGRGAARAARFAIAYLDSRECERVERLVAEELERREREPRDHVGADEGRGRPRLHRLGDAARSEPARRRTRNTRPRARARPSRASSGARGARRSRRCPRRAVAREHEPEALARARGRLRLGGRRRDARDAEQPPQHARLVGAASMVSAARRMPTCASAGSSSAAPSTSPSGAASQSASVTASSIESEPRAATTTARASRSTTTANGLRATPPTHVASSTSPRRSGAPPSAAAASSSSSSLPPPPQGYARAPRRRPARPLPRRAATGRTRRG